MLFHVYIGTKYQGPIRANTLQQAVHLYARKVDRSPLIYRAEPARTVQELKQPAEYTK